MSKIANSPESSVAETKSGTTPGVGPAGSPLGDHHRRLARYLYAADLVAGKRVLISASDSAVKGGTVAPMGLKKALRAQEIARENKLPLVYLVESGGANLMYQSEIFVDGGRSFANQARLSAAGIPQIAVVHGSSTAGGAYLPGLSDYVIAVRNQAKVFLAGPPLVKAAIGEDADDEQLGGAELHASVTGTAEYMAENDAHAIHLARLVMANIARAPFNGQLSHAPRPHAPPRHDIDELLGIVSPDFKKQYDCREVIARLVDDSDFLEFKQLYGSATVCGHAAIEGHACAFIGNKAYGGSGGFDPTMPLPGGMGGAASGGAIHAEGIADILNSTFSGNGAYGGQGGPGGMSTTPGTSGGNGGNGNNTGNYGGGGGAWGGGGVTAQPASASATVIAENSTVRPAVAIVATIASSRVRPSRTSSR